MALLQTKPAPRWVAGSSWACIVLATVVGFLGRGDGAQLWDDALFFRRLGHHLVDHGVAAWNLQDGPVFMATSQLYQGLAALLVAVAPAHFTVGSVFAAAAFLVASFFTLGAAASESGSPWPQHRTAVLFVSLQAPPLLLAAVTGMETCLVVWVVSLFLWLLVHPRWGRHELALAGAGVFVALARPDAVLLVIGAALGVLPSRRSVVRFGVFLAVGLAACCGAAWWLYGTPLPLAAYLKVGPLSVYDAEYRGLDVPGKLLNLRQLALVSLPLAPLVFARRDRLNVFLAGTTLGFFAFHAATTVEIMGYHARFYVPAWPLWVLAALRGLPHALAQSRRWLAVCAVASGLLALSFWRGWVENATDGYEFNFVTARSYGHFFGGLLALAALGAARESAQWRGTWAVVLGLGLSAVLAVPPQRSWVPDELIDARALASDNSLRGLETIRRCFPEPVTLVHSELGVPGVLLLESRIVDYTGLANPAVAHGTFDFEAFCLADRPEFIFRPHWTHRRLNAVLDQSACLRERYVVAANTTALFVRADLAPRWTSCAQSPP